MDSPVRATSAGLYFHTQNSDMLDRHVLRFYVLLYLSVVSIPRDTSPSVSESLCIRQFTSVAGRNRTRYISFSRLLFHIWHVLYNPCTFDSDTLV
jgi:hypothetical protein